MFSRLTKRRRATAVATLAGVAALAAGGLAIADVVTVNNAVNVDAADAKTVGSTGSASVDLTPTQSTSTLSDANGCNAGDGGALGVTVKVRSSDATVVALAGADSNGDVSVLLNDCDPKTFAYSAVGAGTATLSITSASGGKAGSSFTTTDTHTIVVGAAPVTLAAPTVSGSINPASPDGSNGWYVGSPTVSWLIGGGAFASQSADCAPNPRTVSDDTTGTTLTCTATNATGSDSDSVTYKRDATAPTIDATHPAPNSAGWHKANVAVDFECTDGTSGIATGTGGSDVCGPDGTISTEGTGQQLTGQTRDNAGNTNSKTVTVNLDKTAPTIGATFADPNANGWYNGSVAVDFTCSDTGSGIATDADDAPLCGPDGSISGEGSDQELTGTTVDVAGNSASRTVTVDIDESAPNAPTATVSPAANGAGWNSTTPVTVEFASHGDNGPSGVDTCTPTATFSDETTADGEVASGICTDRAGNESAATSRTVKIDKTDPFDVETTLDQDPNEAGWYRGDLTWTTNGDDALSGIAACDTGTYAGGDGTGKTVTGGCTDNAGNDASDTSDEFKYDSTKPEVAVTGVGNGRSYLLGQVPAIGCSTTDATSDVKDQAVATVTGLVVGTKTVSCAGAKDNADNVGEPASVTYSVVYDWNGFLAPVDNPETGKMNGVKAGSAVPLKFTLGSNAGLNVFAFAPRSVAFPCTSAPVEPLPTEAPTTGDALFSNSGLSYDALSGQYTFVWKTDKSMAGQCRQLIIGLNDGSQKTKAVNFKLSK